MITPILERLILQQKAKYYRITVGDSPLSVLQVPAGHTIIITDIEIFANMQIPAQTVQQGGTADISKLLGLLFRVNTNLGPNDDFLTPWMQQNQLYLKGMITQLVEDSQNVTNVYTLNPKQQTVFNGGTSFDQGGNVTLIQYPSFISEKSQYNVLNVHKQNITFRWTYPFQIYPTILNSLATVLIKTGLIKYNGNDPVFNQQLFERDLPTGLKQDYVRATGTIIYNDAQLGLWIPSGKLAIDRTWLSNQFQGQFDFIRYPLIADQNAANANSGAHTVDYNIPDLLAAGANELAILDCIFTYLMRPRANVGYVVINENTSF
jgi:hypothetical protein